MGEDLFVNQPYLTHVRLKGCIVWTHYRYPTLDLARAQELARSRAGQVLLKAVQRNLRLQDLSVSGKGLYEENHIHFYAIVNRMGGYLLSEHHGLAPAVWCHVLDKCQHEDHFATSIMFLHLQQQPNLVHARSRSV
jgi:hypothetical protein